MDEVWRAVVGYEGLYEVSNLGRVRSLCYNGGIRKVPKILKPDKNEHGYLRVFLSKNGKQIAKTVHRLVAEAFLENPLNLPEVNHKDEDKTSNFVFVDEVGTVVPEKSNLEWMSHKDNCNHGTRNERCAKAHLNHPKRSKRVLQFDLEGNFIKEWPSAKEIQRQTGWSHGNISACCRGRFKTSYGFLWRYASE